MKFAFLPNYFKKIGLAFFFASVAFAISISIAITVSSLPELPTDEVNSQSEAFSIGYKIGAEFVMNHAWVAKLKAILLVLSMAFYMLAKEKVDDEYMDAVRWQSLRFSLIITMGVSILSILTAVSLTAHVALAILFTVYLITFKIKKSKFA